MIRNLISHPPLARQTKLACPLTCCLRSFSCARQTFVHANFSSPLGASRCLKAVGSQSVQATVHFNGPTVRLIRHQSTDTLTENQYEKIVSETLESLSDYFDELLENQTKIANYDLSLSDGVLTVNLDSFGTYVINKQTPNKQIWISSPISGPKRYDYIDGVWIYRHDNCSLHELLNREIRSILELNDIDFENCEYAKR